MTTATQNVIDLVTKEHSALGQEVNELFLSCLYEDHELVDGRPAAGCEPVLAEGIVTSVGFHPDRISAAKDRVAALISRIVADEFLLTKGGGYSFLNLCNDREGQQWANLHQTMEQLVQLAIGTQLGGYCLPRSMWAAFPGGMPYVWFKG